MEDKVVLNDVNNVEIKSPVFVDDMNAMGKKQNIEEAGGKMKALEKLKKFTLNNERRKTDIKIHIQQKER